MKRLPIGFWVATLLVSQLAMAQDQVSNIIVKGASSDAQVSEIRRALGFTEGDKPDADTIRLAIKRIGSNPIFKNVRIFRNDINDGLQIIVQVELEPVLEKVEINAPIFLMPIFESRFALFKGQPLSELELKTAIRELQESCQRIGYYQTELEYTFKTLENGNSFLGVEVKGNEPAKIGRVSINSPNKRISDELQQLLELRKGEVYNRDQVLEAIKLWHNDKFDNYYFDVQATVSDKEYSVQTNTVDVSLDVVLGPKYSIRFDGAKYFNSRHLRQLVRKNLSQTDTASSRPKKLESLIIDNYRRHGFRDVRVKVSKELDISVNEGKQFLISQIAVNANNEIQNSFLEARIRSLLRDGYKATLNDPASIQVDDLLVFNERLLVKVKGQVQDELYQQGFLSAKLNGPQVRIRPNGHFVTLAFIAVLGPKTKLGSIVTEVSSLAISDPLGECNTLKSGDTFSSEILESPRSCMEELLWNHGYPYALVSSDIELTEDGQNANIKFRVKQGPFARIGKIEFHGLQNTRPETLSTRIATQIGDAFSLQKLSETRQGLLDTDLFDRIELFTQPIEASDNERILIISLHEKPRTTFELGLGASLEDGPRLSLLTGRRNILGLGIGFKGRLQLNYPALFYRIPFLYAPEFMDRLEELFSEDNAFLRALLYTEAKLSLSLTYPHMLKFPWTTDGISDFSINRELKPAYVLNRVGFDLGLTIKPFSNVRLGPYLQYEFAKFNCPGYKLGLGCGDGPIDAATHHIDKGETQQVTARFSASFDGRDSVMRPRKGYFVDANADLGLGGADLGSQDPHRPIQYFKLQTNFSVFMPLSQGSTWYLSARVGQIFNMVEDSYVPLFKRFYLGGTNSVRGFAEDKVLPADDPKWPATSFAPIDPKTPPLSLGGNFIALLRGEIRFHLGPDYDGAVFLDTGELLESVGNFSLSSLAIGTGFGIRYLTPIGPLMLDLGIRVVDGNRSFDAGFWQLFGFHFSVGYF